MKREMQPVVLAAISGTPRDGAAFEFELNLKQISDIAAFDWASVCGRRVVVHAHTCAVCVVPCVCMLNCPHVCLCV